MSSGVIQIAITIMIISILIYWIKNFDSNKKLYRVLKKILPIIICCVIGIFIFKKVISIKNSYEYFKFNFENGKIFQEYNEKLLEEMEYYKEIINAEYENQNSYTPYIPTGFEYVEGEWNNGFVIQDQNFNQYVWIPCSNNNSKDIPKLEKRNFVNQVFISKDICINKEYKEFLRSALENGGFYISRFEIGIENNKPVSQMGKSIYSNITFDEAERFVSQMYDTNEINCDLINGYAYDTAMYWLKNTNDIEIDIYDVENKECYTGRKEYNRVYDFFDNIMEITSEENFDTVIIRGCVEKCEVDLLSKIGIDNDNFDRFSIRKIDNYWSPYTLLSTRTIIYK